MKTIEDCKVTSGTYMRRLCELLLNDNWLWVILPLALFAIMATWVDVKWVIVVMMALLIALPMALALLYFYYGFSPQARWSIMEKDVSLDERGITLDFAHERMQKHVIPWDDVHNIIEKDDVLMLMLSGKRYTCLMLPASIIDPDVAQLLRQFATQAH